MTNRHSSDQYSKPSEIEDVLNIAATLNNLVVQQLILKLEGKVNFCNTLSAYINESLYQRDIQENYHLSEHFNVQPQHLFEQGFIFKFKLREIDDLLLQ